MREIIFDTETTGLDSREDRIIEIGGIELVNRFPTGRSFHCYINPQGHPIHPEAQAVHGISAEDLADKPDFPGIAEEFMAFIEGAKLVAHNASFDINFINAEFARIGHPPIMPELVVDTLVLAKRKHPMGPNSLDALCRRYGIDNSHRTRHGALLDSELLAEVYIELIGGKQAALGLDVVVETTAEQTSTSTVAIKIDARPAALPSRLSQDERAAHAQLVETIGEKAIWRQIF
ncbi:DNA polymerase III subunit epsilon [Aquamicrobium segne]|uniref:DNA polymerase III subunit epsilon n=1 Tax=Aquamicrobium segne TaxID=469547 RepID=A0ABW0GUI8_9HYPH